MKPLKIYLSPYAYYVRLPLTDLQQEQKKGLLQKWYENRNGQLLCEYMSFVKPDLFSKSKYPDVLSKIGLVGFRILSHNPFKLGNTTGKIFTPKRIISNSEYRFQMIFEANESHSLSPNSKYYTKTGEAHITNISFNVDNSTCNLTEIVVYSDGKETSNYYHLIAPSNHLMEPEYYAIFDFS